jgi:hypothetical protein
LVARLRQAFVRMGDLGNLAECSEPAEKAKGINSAVEKLQKLAGWCR